MPLLAYGLNHLTAPIALREQVAVPAGSMADVLQALHAELGDIEESMLISTCNRTEVVCVTSAETHLPLSRWLARRAQVDVDVLEQACYAYWNEDASRHLMRVASGLDSQVLGEPQILGQVKDGFAAARAAGTLGPELMQVEAHTLRIAKRVRTDTDIGRNPISVAYAAVSLAQQIFGALDGHSALLIGAGDTIELVARHLREGGVGRIVIANRTLAHARALAAECGGEAVGLEDIADQLRTADIVIAATGSPTPILGKGTVEAALRGRRRRAVLMVDIAVPRDIEAQVGELADVYLYSVDDIGAIIRDNVEARRSAAREAEALVVAGVAELARSMRTRDASGTVAMLRQRADAIREEEVRRALAALAAGQPADDVIRRLAHGLTNKLLHKPTVGLREASANGRDVVLAAARELLDLDHSGLR